MNSSETFATSPRGGTSAAAVMETETTRCGLFRRANQCFALEIGLVREVVAGQPLTRVAGAPSALAGLMGLRGEIVPVAIADDWLGLVPQSYDPARPLLLLRQRDLYLGIQIDAVLGVVAIPSDEIQPRPASSHASALGVWQRPRQPLVTLIDGTVLIDSLQSAIATTSSALSPAASRSAAN